MQFLSWASGENPTMADKQETVEVEELSVGEKMANWLDGQFGITEVNGFGHQIDVRCREENKHEFTPTVHGMDADTNISWSTKPAVVLKHLARDGVIELRRVSHVEYGEESRESKDGQEFSVWLVYTIDKDAYNDVMTEEYKSFHSHY